MYTYGDVISRLMIHGDARFTLSFLQSVMQMDESSRYPFLFASLDFSALITYEAAQFIMKKEPSEASKFKSDYADIVKQSRQRMKIFDDKLLGVKGVGEVFSNTLVPEHLKKMSEDHIVPLPRWMWSDISLYVDGASGIPISSTHLASFSSGITNPKDLFSGKVAHGLGEHLGRFMAYFAGKAVNPISVSAPNITVRDIRYEDLYSLENYGSSEVSVNAGLSVIDMKLNFLAICLKDYEESFTLFKWKFLTIYHAISSLTQFAKTVDFKNLSEGKKALVELVLASELSGLMQSDEAKILRNTLTHYGIDSRVNSSALILYDKNDHGLVSEIFSDWTYVSLYRLIDQELQTNLLDIFHIWKKNI
jgi:hypothetical protein